jgi:NADH-quinone oxidoreductase subunit C
MDNQELNTLQQATQSVSFVMQNLLLVQEKFCLSISSNLNEDTVIVPIKYYLSFVTWLQSDVLLFEQLMDLCGVDYSEYPNNNKADDANARGRYAVVLHLLSIQHNARLRVKVFLAEDLPVVPSVMPIWASANWYEREAFDLYGILFDGHNDLRRILTDYGFIGHPMQKDFPTTGFVEMRYDEVQKRVIYQPVSIEERIITPRIVREQAYGTHSK